MQPITGLLIDPIKKVSTIVHFWPTPQEFRRLIGVPFIVHSKSQTGKLCYTAVDRVAIEDDPIVIS